MALHGYRSRENGIIYEDKSSLTTALEIVERILLKRLILKINRSSSKKCSSAFKFLDTFQKTEFVIVFLH